ncbi:hypothetical protein CSA56_15425 [candidate division KSB3 bacterium]|uniref:MurR/RpiR family transcriptional regulator n=1 Tax=candidate division KSB3 bacterium TaxID=2044937 RepID=A0A2G6KAT7_9BACT|nr:MAG: hypothetical protein CSA56_15425 [candidate division KSB3 bacterium]
MRLLEKLRLRYSEMTEGEKLIYNLMTKNVKEFSLKPIGAVAEELQISKTTLMRFAKSSGFNGYAEFKQALQEEELLDSSPAVKLKKFMNNHVILTAEKIRQQEIENIHHTFQNLNKEDFDRIVDTILSTNSIRTMGWGISSYAAEVLTLRLKLIGLKCETLQRRTATLVEEVSRLAPSALFITFEFRPYMYEVLDAVRLAKSRNMTLVLVTDTPQCPLIEFVDYIFYCETETEFFGNSLIGPLFWVNLLTSEVIYRMKDNIMDTLERQQEILTNLRYYIP